MPNCSVKFCTKNSMTSSYAKDGITFHRFPKIPEIKEIWINSTMRENWFPSKFSVYCSRHFTPDCFESLQNKRRRLFTSAIPTLRLPILTSAEEEKTPSDDEDPATSPVKIEDEKDNSSSAEIKTVPTLNVLKNIEATPKKVLVRTITDLSMKLKKTQIVVKKLQDANRSLKKKMTTMKSLLEKLKNKELITQDSIDIDRLRNSNRQLRMKVTLLRRLLNEQKKKKLAEQQNVVWCPAAEESRMMTVKQEASVDLSLDES